MSAIPRVWSRWAIVVGAVMIQLALGAMYGWSVFTKLLTETASVRRIFNPIGDPVQPPPITPARGPPMWDDGLMHAVPDWDALAQPEPEYVFDQQVQWQPSAGRRRPSPCTPTALDPTTKRRHTPLDHRDEGALATAPPRPGAHALACMLCRR